MLPEPMLAKPGPLPAARGWSFEPKWDAFRAIVRSGEAYCVQSRRGWLMTQLLPEFVAIPVEGVFDDELVAFGDDGRPRSSVSPAESCTATQASRSRSSSSTCSRLKGSRRCVSRQGAARDPRAA
jgi:hypothetical protein